MRLLILLCCLLFGAISGFSQTYYWVGGAGPAAFHGTAANWNTMLDGSGTTRGTATSSDVLIFDGTNIGGAVPTTGTVFATAQTHTFGQLILQNGADVNVQRTSSNGTGNLIIGGDGTAADDLIINAGCSFTITSSIALRGLTVTLASTATGSVAGNVYILDANIFTARLYVKDANALNFTSGSKCYINNPVSGDYPFGTATVGGTFGATGGTSFKAGSELIYQGGVSPYSSSTHVPIFFEKGSTLILEAANLTNIFVNHTLANVRIRNSATVDPENFYNIDTLTVETGSTFRLRTTGGSPFAGNIVNNGTFGANTPIGTSQLIMLGTVPQTIGGSGTFTDVATLAIAADADVTLNRDVLISSVSTSNICGKLNTQANRITGSGDFQLRSALSATSNGTLSSNNTVVLDATVYATGINTANVAIGTLVSGTGIPANTYIISTNSGSSSFTISKAATITTAPLAASITISSNAATLETSHAGGVDGTIMTTGSRTFSTGSHYIFNGPTVAPFSTSTTNTTGNVTFNAAATTNKSLQRIGGTLTLNTGKLTIPAPDTIRITSGNAIAGGPFSSSKYIVTGVSGNNLGVLRIDNLPAPSVITLFPVGSVNYYLPVSLNPVSVVDHVVSVFEGVTEDGTVLGTPFTPAKKADVVDAVWIVNRPNGTGNCTMELGWNAALEGASFASFANSNMGISRHNGAAWGICLGAGDNTLNTATAAFSTFSPFGVGYNGAILANQIKSIYAYIKLNNVEIKWELSDEAGIQRYEIEKSVNRTDFLKIGTVDAANKLIYNFIDVSVLNDVVFYRIKIIGISGDIKYTDIVMVKKKGNNGISLYPNPVVNSMTISGLTNASAYKIVNATGQVMMQQKTLANSINIDLRSLQSGLYFVEIISSDNISIKQSFIKQ